VQGLVLVDPAVGKGNRGPVPQWASSLMASPQIRNLALLLVRTISGEMGNDTIRMAWHDPSRIDPEVYAGYRKPLKVNNWDKALYEFTIAGNPVNYSKRLANLTMPVLVVTGDDDRIVPTDQSIQLSREIPGAELGVLKDCGHVPQEECPDQFMTSMQAFLEDEK
jgi:pimeloyl-ACP methyl ester carboxylesterase